VKAKKHPTGAAFEADVRRRFDALPAKVRAGRLVRTQLRLGVPIGQMANKMPPAIGARLAALWTHWQHTRNATFAAEAVAICVEAKVNPPAWALGVVGKGLRKHLTHPRADVGVQMGFRRRGKTQPIDEYRQRHDLDAAMRMIWRLSKSPIIGVADAARRAKKKYPRLRQSAETLARYYSRDWLPLYEAVNSTD